jgi:hypothetical protein
MCLITLTVFQLTVSLDYVVLLLVDEAWTRGDMIRIRGETRVTFPQLERVRSSERILQVRWFFAYIILPSVIWIVQNESDVWLLTVKKLIEMFNTDEKETKYTAL